MANRADIQTQIDTRLPDNSTNEIEAVDTRTTQTLLNQSVFNKESDTADDILDGAGKVIMTTAERTKLGNVPVDTNSELANKQNTSEKGAANGYASLGADGKIPAAQIPDVAISEYLGAVPDEPSMLALVGQRGDWCTRTDLGTNFVIIGEPSSNIANWQQLSYPTAPVTSVNTKTGAVVLDADDIADTASRQWISNTSQTIAGEKTFSEEIIATKGIISYRPVQAQNGSFIVDANNANLFLLLTSTAADTITVDDTSAAALITGQELEIFWFSQTAPTDTVNFVASGAQTIISENSSLSLRGLGSGVILKYLGSNQWALIGGLI